jgi:hypothetical protein
MAKTRLNLGYNVQHILLKAQNVFGSEEAPPTFYADADVFRTARDAGLTMDELVERNDRRRKSGIFALRG